MKTSVKSIIAVAVGSVAISQFAAAATYVWDENGATAGFGTAGTVGTTWSSSTSLFTTDTTGATAPTGTQATTTGDSTNFGTSSLALGAGTISVGTVSSGAMNFGSANTGTIVLSGGTITLGGNVTNSGSVSQTINSNLALGSTGRSLFGTLSIGGNITGGQALTIGSATAANVTLTGTNTFSGGLQVNNATLSVSSIGDNGSTTSSIGSGTVALGGSNSTGALRYIGTGETANRTINLQSSSTSNGGAIYQDGTGTLTLTGAITGSGINKTLTLRGSGVGVSTGAITDSVISLGLTKGDAGTWTLAGANNYHGATSVVAGTLDFAKQASLYNATTASWTPTLISVNSGATFALGVGASASGYFDSAAVDSFRSNMATSTTTTGFKTGAILGFDTTNAAAGTFTYNSNITNFGTSLTDGVTKLGVGTLVLGGANTYTGATTIKNGSLALGSTGSLSSSTSVVLGDATANTSGVFQLGDSVGAANTTVASLATAGTGTANAVTGGNASSVSNLTVSFASGSVTYAGLLGSGTAGASTANNLALVKAGSGTTLTLSGTNTFTGGTTISNGGGTVAISTGGALGSGTVAIGTDANTGGNARLQLSGGITVPNTISVATQTASSTATAARIENLSGNNTLSGDISQTQGGGAAINVISTAGKLTLGGNLTSTLVTTAQTRTFNFSGAGDFDVTGKVLAATGTSANQTIAVAKGGGGTLALSNANTYTGGTTLTAGTLLVNGGVAGTSSGTGTGGVTVSGGTFGGSGVASGAVSIGAAGILSPGNGVGTLTVGAASLVSGATFATEINGTTAGTSYDQLVANNGTVGNVSLGSSTLSLALGFAPTVGNTFTLVNNDGTDAVVGTFAGLTQGSTIDATYASTVYRFSVDYAGGTGNDVVLTNVAIPEPASLAALALGSAGLLTRRRRVNSSVA